MLAFTDITDRLRGHVEEAESQLNMAIDGLNIAPITDSLAYKTQIINMKHVKNKLGHLRRALIEMERAEDYA